MYTESDGESFVITQEEHEIAVLKMDNYALLSAEYLMQKLGVEDYYVDVVDNHQHPFLEHNIVLRVSDLPNWIIYRECSDPLLDEGNLIAEYEIGSRFKLHISSAEDFEWLKVSTYCLK